MQHDLKNHRSLQKQTIFQENNDVDTSVTTAFFDKPVSFEESENFQSFEKLNR